MDTGILANQFKAQIASGDLAEAFHTKALIDYSNGVGSRQQVMDASVRRQAKPEYNTEFDSFVAQYSGGGQSAAPINVKGTSTTARSGQETQQVVNNISHNNITQ